MTDHDPGDYAWRVFVALCLFAIIGMLIYVTYVSNQTLTLYQDVQRQFAPATSAPAVGPTPYSPCVPNPPPDGPCQTP